MTGYSPPRVSNDTAVRLAVAALGVLLAGVIVRRVLAVVVALSLAVVAYVVWRFLRALEAIADGTQRIAAARERAGDGGSVETAAENDDDRRP